MLGRCAQETSCLTEPSLVVPPETPRRRNELIPREATAGACRTWHSALDGLAQTFDRVLAERLQALIGFDPW